MKFSISILLIVCITFGCCSIPKDLILAIDDDFAIAKAKLEVINSQPSGKGLISEMYFDDISNRNKAWWYLLPDNTLLGINTALQDSDDVEKSKITKILLGEISAGFSNKIRWDMQVKTQFQQIDLAKHKSNRNFEKTIVLEVGLDYADVLRCAKNNGCNNSDYSYEYVQNENVKYDWLQLPDNSIVQLCGFRDEGEQFLKLSEIKVCNSRALFSKKVESWYSARSIRITNIGKKIWGIDVQSSYFNVYNGMSLTDALKTLKTANCTRIVSESNYELNNMKILSDSWSKDKIQINKFYRFKIKDDAELLISASVPVDGACKKVDALYAITKVPDIKTSKSVFCLVEFEFIDLVRPFMPQWFEQID